MVDYTQFNNYARLFLSFTQIHELFPGTLVNCQKTQLLLDVKEKSWIRLVDRIDAKMELVLFCSLTKPSTKFSSVLSLSDMKCPWVPWKAQGIMQAIIIIIIKFSWKSLTTSRQMGESITSLKVNRFSIYCIILCTTFHQLTLFKSSNQYSHYSFIMIFHDFL